MTLGERTWKLLKCECLLHIFERVLLSFDLVHFILDIPTHQLSVLLVQHCYLWPRLFSESWKKQLLFSWTHQCIGGSKWFQLYVSYKCPISSMEGAAETPESVAWISCTNISGSYYKYCTDLLVNCKLSWYQLCCICVLCNI